MISNNSPWGFSTQWATSPPQRPQTAEEEAYAKACEEAVRKAEEPKARRPEPEDRRPFRSTFEVGLLGVTGTPSEAQLQQQIDDAMRATVRAAMAGGSNPATLRESHNAAFRGPGKK